MASQPRKRDYRAEYARRKAAAQAAGFTSPRTVRDYRARQAGRPRDFTREYQRAKEIAQDLGFRNIDERREFNRAKRAGKKVESGPFQKRKILKYFGVSEARFEQIRKENQAFHQEWGMLNQPSIYIYDEGRDFDTDNWTEDRVGYILSYNSAVVNYKTNFFSDRPSKRIKENGVSKSVTVFKRNSKGVTITKENQWWYLVKYAKIMSVSEFDSRYGMTNGNSLAAAARARGPRGLGY